MGLKEEIEKMCEENGFGDKVKVAAVYGDDILDKYEQLKQNNSIQNFDLEGEEEIPPSQKIDWTSMNVYFGARGIVEALKLGANVIVNSMN